MALTEKASVFSWSKERVDVTRSVIIRWCSWIMRDVKAWYNFWPVCELFVGWTLHYVLARLSAAARLFWLFYFWRKSPMPPNTQDWLISAVCCVCVRRCTTDPDLTLSSWGGGGFGTDAGEDVKQWTEITELLSRCRLIRSETHVFYTLWLKRVLLSHFYCFINDRFTIEFSVMGHLTPCSLCDSLPHTCSWDAH